MLRKTKSCPECLGTMEFRLGRYECSSCGLAVAAEAVERDDQPAQPDDGIHRVKLKVPEQKADLPAYATIGLKEPETDLAGQRFGAEKVLFLTVFFVFQVISSFVFYARYFGAAEAAVFIPGLLVSALIAVFGAACTLYYDSTCLRQTCLVCSGLVLLTALGAVIMAFTTSQAGLAWPLLPNIVLIGWFVSILLRISSAE